MFMYISISETTNRLVLPSREIYTMKCFEMSDKTESTSILEILKVEISKHHVGRSFREVLKYVIIFNNVIPP